MSDKKTIFLANPRGFCAGVSRAIEIVNRVLNKYQGKTIYVFHEVVHNKHVVDDLIKKGAIFVEDINEIPVGAIVVFSAHGVSDEVLRLAKERALQIFDATCPIVEKVHRKVRNLSQIGEEVIMIGHKGHQEVEGTLGQYLNPEGGMYIVTSGKDLENIEVKNPDKLHFVTQTTLSLDETKQCIEDLRKKFPNIQGPNGPDVCYATQNRQLAVKNVSKLADLVLVVGSKNSSNSNRLKEVAKSEGVESYLIDDYKDLTDDMLNGKTSIAITAGASAPEYLINDLIHNLEEKGFKNIEEIGYSKEKQNFLMPKGLE
jgi:4-hydroxy-3-methylbut-2-enyl diphosphate reductase